MGASACNTEHNAVYDGGRRERKGWTGDSRYMKKSRGKAS